MPETYNIYRTENKSDIGLLKNPIVTGLTEKTYIDSTVEQGKIY